jgi:hypothetical protein
MLEGIPCHKLLLNGGRMLLEIKILITENSNNTTKQHIYDK